MCECLCGFLGIIKKKHKSRFYLYKSRLQLKTNKKSKTNDFLSISSAIKNCCLIMCEICDFYDCNCRQMFDMLMSWESFITKCIILAIVWHPHNFHQKLPDN